MKFKIIILLLSYLIIHSTSYGQNNHVPDSTEQQCIKVFRDFSNYIQRNKMNGSDITNDKSINHILLNYLFIDRQLDSTGSSQSGDKIFKEGELITFKRELLDYTRFFQENSDSAIIDNIDIIPLRLSHDTFIYDRMTNFQKANTYVLYDKRNPEKILFYLLFIPPIKDYINEPRIWSWKLGYEYGKFIFTAPNGEEGHEHIFP